MFFLLSPQMTFSRKLGLLSFRPREKSACFTSESVIATQSSLEGLTGMSSWPRANAKAASLSVGPFLSKLL